MQICIIEEKSVDLLITVLGLLNDQVFNKLKFF